MKVIVGLLASISLVVGGVGIMNIMLVSVSERARDRNPQSTGRNTSRHRAAVLVEATLFSGVGGAFGADWESWGAARRCDHHPLQADVADADFAARGDCGADQLIADWSCVRILAGAKCKSARSGGRHPQSIRGV